MAAKKCYRLECPGDYRRAEQGEVLPAEYLWWDRKSKVWADGYCKGKAPYDADRDGPVAVPVVAASKPSSRDWQIEFLRRVSGSVVETLISHMLRAPGTKEWDGHELRRLLYDAHHDSAAMSSMRGKRLSDYRNSLITTAGFPNYHRLHK